MSHLHAQSSNVCPDFDSDGMVGVSDILTILTYFGEEMSCSSSSTGSWEYVEEFDCSNPMTVVEGQEPKAIVLYHESSANLDFGTYMNDNGSEFYGFGYGTTPQSNEDVALYLSWPGWISNSDAHVVEVDVPQTTGGVDSFGNGRVAHVFETAQLTDITNVWVTVLVPQSVMPTEDSFYSTAVYDINGSPSPCVAAQLSTSISSFQGCYTGSDFAHGVYRMYTTFSGVALNWLQIPNGYIKGGAIQQ